MGELPPERAVRIIRAHVGNLETHISHLADAADPNDAVLFDVVAATSLFGELLAELIERVEKNAGREGDAGPAV